MTRPEIARGKTKIFRTKFLIIYRRTLEINIDTFRNKFQNPLPFNHLIKYPIKKF